MPWFLTTMVLTTSWNSSFSAEVDNCLTMGDHSVSAELSSGFGIRSNISYQEVNPAESLWSTTVIQQDLPVEIDGIFPKENDEM